MPNLHDVLRALASPVMALRDEQARLFFPYLLSALGLASVVWFIKLRRRVSWRKFLFPAEIWLHPSALFDLRFMVVRALFDLLFIVPLLLTSAYWGTWVKTTLQAQLGTGPLALPPAFGLFVVSWGAFLGEDFMRYQMHRLAHRVPLLWQFHQVHHSARVLTPLTVYRSHPLDAWLMRSAAYWGLGFSAGFCAWLVACPLTVWNVLGVFGLSFLWNLSGSNLRHSHIWLSYPRWLQPWLHSPASHQIHHSQDPAHHDKNFGSSVAIWDALFGTLYKTGPRLSLSFGLTSSEQNHQETILSAALRPFLGAGRTFSQFFVREASRKRST